MSISNYVIHKMPVVFEKKKKKKKQSFEYGTIQVISWLLFVVVALLFYVHGKHLRSCRDGQLT